MSELPKTNETVEVTLKNGKKRLAYFETYSPMPHWVARDCTHPMQNAFISMYDVVSWERTT